MISKAQKEYCMHNLASSVIQRLEYEDGKTPAIAAAMFMQSKTYVKLLDPGTGLWAEGADYIFDLFKSENAPK